MTTHVPNDTGAPIRVLVLGGQRTVEMLKRHTAYEVGLADEAIPFDLLALADFPLEVDFDDWHSVAEQVERLHSLRPITAVVTGVDRLVPLAGLLRERLGLSTGITSEAARDCRDKAVTNRRLEAAGVPVAGCRVVSSTAQGHAAAEEIGLPVVVKPRDASSAAGLAFCASLVEVAQAVTDVLRTGRDSVLVEEFLAGPEIGVFASRVAGRTTVLYVADGEVGPPPKFVKLGGRFPSSLSDAELTEIGKLTDQALGAVSLDNWVASLQFVLTEAGPKAGEINPRVSGGQGVALIAATSGYEPTLVAVEAALGRRTEPGGRHAAVGLYRSIVFDEAGRVRYHPEALHAIEGLESSVAPQIEFDMAPGEVVLPINHPRGGAFGRIVLAGASADALARDYGRIIDQLDIRVEPETEAEAKVDRPHTSCC